MPLCFYKPHNIIEGDINQMKTIVIGVIGADVHAVGNKIIEYVLKNEGYNVVNIGVLSSQEDFNRLPRNAR